MSVYVPNSRHLREVLLFCYNLKKNAVEAHRMLSETYGDAALSERTCREWFQRFKNGDFDVEDKHGGGREKTCIWWDQLGVIYYELLKPGETITGDRYRTQLMRLSRALKEKRPQYQERHDKVILQHDNARPHVAKVVKKYLETLKWEVLPHPPYSPDVAPSDFHLFRSMAHGLADQHFQSFEELEKWIASWIASKEDSFFRAGIRKLPERWEKVIASDGQYFE